MSISFMPNISVKRIVFVNFQAVIQFFLTHYPIGRDKVPPNRTALGSLQALILFLLENVDNPYEGGPE